MKCVGMFADTRWVCHCRGVRPRTRRVLLHGRKPRRTLTPGRWRHQRRGEKVGGRRMVERRTSRKDWSLSWQLRGASSVGRGQRTLWEQLSLLITPSGRITWRPEGAWPPERPGAPCKTSGLRGYKGPHEITCQYMIAIYHVILSTDVDAFCPPINWYVASGGGLDFFRLAKFYSRLFFTYLLLCLQSILSLMWSWLYKLRKQRATEFGIKLEIVSHCK